MDIKVFIEKFAKTIEAENIEGLSPDTEFHDLDEWSSISVILVIAFFDEEFGKQTTSVAIREANTIQDLYNLATTE